MNGSALDRVFRSASGRIVGALAARFRDLEISEEAFSTACERAARHWVSSGVPNNPEGWLYRVAYRAALDMLRIAGRSRAISSAEMEIAVTDAPMDDDERQIPDDRLRLLFICCHPALASHDSACLALRLVCNLSVAEIARAFLLAETTLSQRLVRAKRKIAEAGIPFGLPPPQLWTQRIEAVLIALEVAYSKAHEDAAGSNQHAGFAVEITALTKMVAELLPDQADALALAAVVRFSEARRPARVDAAGMMVPLSEQDPLLWNAGQIAEANAYLARSRARAPSSARVLQAELQAVWCSRKSLEQAPPWRAILDVYNRLLAIRDDPVIRLNRIVAIAEADGLNAAINELNGLDRDRLSSLPAYHAVQAQLFGSLGNLDAAVAAYDKLLQLPLGAAERRWLENRKQRLSTPAD